MIFLIILIAILIPYLTVGARYSRNRYAALNSKNKSGTTAAEIATRRKSLEAQLISLKSQRPPDVIHADFCEAHEWYSPSIRRDHCSCGNAKKATRIERQIIALNDPMVPDEPSVFMPMVAWPLYAAGSYLKSGVYTPRGYDPTYTAQLEKTVLELGDR